MYDRNVYLREIIEHCKSLGDIPLSNCDACAIREDPKAWEICSNKEFDEMSYADVEYLFSVINGTNNEPEEFEPVEDFDPVDRPKHYTDGKIEVIDFIEDKGLGFCLGNAVKYIARAGKKDPTKEVEDINKAIWYLNRYLKELEEGA